MRFLTENCSPSLEKEINNAITNKIGKKIYIFSDFEDCGHMTSTLKTYDLNEYHAKDTIIIKCEHFDGYAFGYKLKVFGPKGELIKPIKTEEKDLGMGPFGY